MFHSTGSKYSLSLFTNLHFIKIEENLVWPTQDVETCSNQHVKTEVNASVAGIQVRKTVFCTGRSLITSE